MTLQPTREQDLPAWLHDVPHLFIVGSPRSGTTWIHRMLLDLDGVVGGPETQFFIGFASALHSYEFSLTQDKRAGLGWYLDYEAFLRELRRLWVIVMGPLVEQVEHPRVLIEKTPSHARFVREIHMVLPAVRFLHVIRDGRAVAASLMAASKTWARSWAPSRAREAIRLWKRHVRAAREARELVGNERYLEVRYEEMLAQPLEGLRRIARFAGLDPAEEALSPVVERHDADAIRAGLGHAVWAGEPEGFLRTAKADAWRRDLGLWDRVQIRSHAGSFLRSLGYR
ncbi:MAG: sulfotransferase [Planctomycetota bacterium]